MPHLYYSANLTILREHIRDESRDLIYLAPHLNTQATDNVLFRALQGNTRKRKLQPLRIRGMGSEMSEKTTGYCWRTQKCRNLCIPHAFFEGQKSMGNCTKKVTSRTLK